MPTQMKMIVSRQLVTVITVMVLGTLAAAILQPILPLYLTSIGVIPTVLGLMFSVRMTGMAMGEASWGWIGDKVGLRIPISTGAFVCALVVFCFLLTQKIPVIFLIFFFWGSVSTAYLPVGRGYIGATAPLLKKATFMAIFTTIMAASRSLGALMSGFVVDSWGYKWSFFISCGIVLLGGFVAITGLKKIRLTKPDPPTVSGSSTEELPSPNQTYSYLPIGFQGTVAALYFIGMGISMTFLPLLATQVVGVDATAVGILFTIGGAVTMILSIPLAMLSDRKGKRIFMILGLLVSASGMAGVAFAESFPWLIVFVSIRSLGAAMFSPAALGLLSESVPRQRQSTAMGFYGVCEITGIIVGSALGGFVWSAWGPRVTFLLGTLAAGMAATICFSLVRDKVFKNS